jgi:hypothetical protein
MAPSPTGTPTSGFSTTTLTGIQTGIDLATSFLQIAPAILQLISMIAALFGHKAAAGPAKKAVVLAAIPTELHPLASTFIDTVVAQANTIDKSLT